ncbi:VWA domain-containing protein [Frankia sp. Cr2]|uniref:VWA domain-containing protein n=1 Tax=Frankia sp. Cr2 TaxID=3073932 RepID=UPI002AD2C34F|nr:VWA domain-containing protein [Frankia sp. Cr2]
MSQEALAAPPPTAVDWKAVVDRVATATYQKSAQQYQQEADRRVRPFADPKGIGRLDALAAQVAAGYLDGARFATEKNGLKVYDRDVKAVAWLKSRLDGWNPQRGESGQAHADALTGLLLASRESAEIATRDAAVALGEVPDAPLPTGPDAEPTPSENVAENADVFAEAAPVATDKGRDAALRQLTSARRHLARAQVALHRGLPVTAAIHDGLAWRYAYHALVDLGIVYTADTDHDGVTDLLELTFGTSPFSVDTDHDGLRDAFEINKTLTWTLPSKADTDGDGVSDAAEDIDGDGLSNLAEQAAGTDPTEPDTDSDSVSDGAELAAGTDPRKADTDGDTLLDGVEPRQGLSPLKADTDGDGIRDDHETVRAVASGPDGVQAVVIGTGDLLTELRVTKVTGSKQAGIGVPGQVGAAYDFSLPPPAYQGFTQAELTIPYDPSTAAKPSALRLFYLDEQRGIWRPATVTQTVDTERHVVRATVDHFSTYAVFDIVNWQQTWTASQDPCRTRGGGSGTDVVLLDLSLILDSSGSMAWNDPQGLRKSAAKNFVDALLPDDRAAVVDFDYTATVLQGLTSDKAVVKAAIDRIDDSGGTDIGAGVRAGTDLLIASNDPQRARIAILLTDGVGSYDPALTRRAQTNKIAIYTIGLGSEVDENLLRGIATGTGGQYYGVDTAADLPQVFRRISEDTGGDPDIGKDTDGDGLDDCTEIKGMRDGYGVLHVSDPAKPDTDGDGLTDGEEAGQPVDYRALTTQFGADFQPLGEAGTKTWTMPSAPDIADTDGDGLDDADELDVESNAWLSDSDGDGLSDGTELEVGSSPTSANTDGDAFDDAYEVAHADDGLDPGRPDEKVSTWTYAKDFAIGAILGDFMQKDSLAWLAGYLAASASSAIPVIGWITGTLADLRDTIANAIHGDWVGAGLSGISLVPDVGDAVAVPGKAAKFVAKYAHRLDDVVRLMAKADKLPNKIKTVALRALLLGRYDTLLAAGFSEEAIRLVAKGDRTYLKAIADAVGSGLHKRASALPEWAGRLTVAPLGSGAEGEDLLAQVYRVPRNKKVEKMEPPLIGNGRRTFDVVEQGPEGRIAHEAKVGNDPRSDGLRQCRKDGALVRQGKIAAAHWHFFTYSRYSSIGADPEVLACLVQEGIRFTFHPPA